MNKLIGSLVAVIVGVSFMGSGTVSAEECKGATVTNTGPGSTNVGRCVESSKVTVSCVNDIYVVDKNSQDAHSGDATSSGNTMGGKTVITGNATNENGSNVQIGASCATQPAAPTTPTKPTAPTTPTTPVAPAKPISGQGAAAQPIAAVPSGSGAVVPIQPEAAMLPDTASNNTTQIAAVATAVLGGTLIISRLAIQFYRRLALG